MSHLQMDILRFLAALLAAASATAFALGALRLCGWLQRLVFACTAGLGAEIGPRRGGVLRALLAPLAMLNERWIPQARQQQIRAQLVKAGHPFELEPVELVGLMEVGCAGCGLLGGVTALSSGISAGWAAVFAVFGAATPLLWLRDRIKVRHHQIGRALPYDLDLLTLSVEAGLDFTAAMSKVVEKGRPGPLADELSVALKELKLGKTREEALRNLARRCGLSTLTSFVQALVQADRMGTPLGKTLRVLSAQMRVERTQRAEKLAGEAPVKLLLPLIGCIFPTIFLMLFGPIVYQVFSGGSF